MARYPTFDEYAKRGAFDEGIQRCDELLSRSPKDVELLVTKLRLICASKPDSEDGPKVLEQLASIQPPIQDLREIVPIEVAVVESFKNTCPPPLSAGPAVAKFWDNAFKTNTNVNYRLDLLSERFSRAVLDNRIQDAQQTLIQLKAYQPKNRAIYMAHAAYTQLLSTSKDDLQSRLALSLARKAVTEKFDDDKALDCRVSGQIFAIQGSEKDLESIRERPALRETKQVYEALQLHKQPSANGEPSSGSVSTDPEKVSTREWLSSEVDKLRLEFQKLIDANALQETVTAFVSNAVRLFHTATTSLNLGARNRVASDPCFLVVSGLIKLFLDTADDAYLLQAAYLTERLLKFNLDVHEARLILIYLYMRLSLGSDAIRLFDSLSIKEIQHDTVGHTLFTRLSVTHPFRTQLPSLDWFEPHERTNKALQIYPRHEDKLSDMECAVLNHAQAGMIFDLNQLRSELRQSWMRRAILLEHRRIARLAGKGYGKGTSELGPRVVANWINTKDNRDFNAAFDHGLNVEKALYSSNGVQPGAKCLLYSLAVDTAWSIAGKQIPLIVDTEKLVETLSAAVSDSKDAQGELTGAEYLAGRAIHKVLPVLQTVKSGSSPSKDSIDAISTALGDLPISELCKTKDKLAEHLTDHYTYIDSLLIVHRTCKYIKETAEHIPQEVASLQSTAMKFTRELQIHATEQATSLEVGDVVNSLEQHETIAKELKEFGTDHLDEFAKAVVASAKEGWEGVNKIMLPS